MVQGWRMLSSGRERKGRRASWRQSKEVDRGGISILLHLVRASQGIGLSNYRVNFWFPDPFIFFIFICYLCFGVPLFGSFTSIHGGCETSGSSMVLFRRCASGRPFREISCMHAPQLVIRYLWKSCIYNERACHLDGGEG